MKKLRILMLTKYFSLRARGGSEYSTYHLVKSLIQRGHKVFFKFSLRDRPDIIHLQSPSFLPLAVIIGKLFNIPTILTVRDYYLICPLGFCLWSKIKACSLREFWFNDIPTYTRSYPSHFLSPLFHLGHRINSQILRYFAHQVDQIVCVSEAQKRIFAANGWRNLRVIYNATEFPSLEPKTRTNRILFVGRLTPGKGADLLISLAEKYEIIVVGNGFLVSRLKHHNLKLRGYLKYQQVLKLYRQVKLAIFPSRWPEPFGRGALEAIAAGTPVVTSNRGGLPEIVQNKYGLAVEPTPEKLAQAIDYALKHYRQFTGRIAADQRRLTRQFSTKPTDQYEQLYYRCLA